MKPLTLFSALTLYTKLYHKPFSEAELTDGLPQNPGTGENSIFSCSNLLDNFGRAAARAGLTTNLKKRTLDEISPLTLPAILVLKDETGCILESINKEKTEFLIYSPDSVDVKQTTTKEKLEEEYSGFLFFVGEKFDYHGRAKPSIENVDGHWFWKAIKLSKTIYIDVIKASLAINLFVLASPLFTMNVYDRVVPNNAVETLWMLGIGVMVVFVLDAILKFLRTYFLELAAKKSDVIISSSLFEKVLDLRMEQAPRNIGSFASNFKEFDSIRNFLASSVTTAIIDLPFTVIFLWVIWFIGGNIVTVPIIMMCLLLIYTLLIRKPLFKSIASSFEVAAKKNSLLIESLSGLQDIKFLNAAGIFQWRWENVVAELANKGLQSRMLTMSISTLTGVLIQLNTVLIVIYGVYLIRDLELTMGGLIAVVIISSRTIAPMGQVVGLLSNYEQTKVAYDSLEEIMNREVETPQGTEFIRHERIKGNIEFKDVSFTYPNSEKPAIKNVSFKIKPGEKIALIGKTGSGKSTVQKLIMAFYRSQEGSVQIDGLDVGQLSPVFLRRNVSYVPQDFSLFAGTLRENITWRAPYADDRAIISAACAGGLEKFISSHPRGFDAFVEERGSNLSGGQKQGIAIARTLLTNTDLFLFDEPTNSMDVSTEALVKSHIYHRIKNKTMILTTHKQGMLDLAERIIVMDEGIIIFDGPREECLKKFSRPSIGEEAENEKK